MAYSNSAQFQYFHASLTLHSTSPGTSSLSLVPDSCQPTPARQKSSPDSKSQDACLMRYNASKFVKKCDKCSIRSCLALPNKKPVTSSLISLPVSWQPQPTEKRPAEWKSLDTCLMRYGGPNFRSFLLHYSWTTGQNAEKISLPPLNPWKKMAWDHFQLSLSIGSGRNLTIFH